jgi:hypothetical protein
MPAPKITQFAGDIRMWRKAANGALTPVIADSDDASGNQPIEANAAVFSYEAGDTIEVKSKRRGSRYNQPTYSEVQPGTSALALTLLELPPLIMARVLYGSATETTVNAGSVTDAALAITRKDAPIQLPHRLLDDSPAPVIENGGTPLVEGTDYEIDLRRGQVLIKAAGVAVDDPDVTISYSYFAHTKVEYVGGGSPTETFYITGDMENRVDGENGELEIYEAKLSVDGDIDLFSEEPITAVLKGSLIVPSDQDEPYKWTTYAAT